MKKLFVSLLGLLAVLGANANDSMYYTQGNQLVPMQSTDISVAKEILTIKLQNDRMTTVDVYYEFENKGQAQDVKMGFEAMPPYMESKFNAAKQNPYIKNFTVEMNGQKMTYKNAIAMTGVVNGMTPVDLEKWKKNPDADGLISRKNKDTYANYSYVYYFTAHFKPGKNIIHHTYKYDNSAGVCHAFWIDYKLTPATRWANHQIDDFTLRIVGDNTSKHFMVSKNPFMGADFKVVEGVGKVRDLTAKSDEDSTKLNHFTEVTMRNGVAEWHATNFCPKAELYISSVDEYVELGKYIDLKTSDGKKFDETSYYDGGGCVPFCLPVKDRTLGKRIVHNLPFAARGYVFKDANLKNYFESQWWYMPDSSYKSSSEGLTKSDKDLIKGTYDEMMGNLSDD